MSKLTDDDLFEPPALIAGEDRERYMRLHAAVEDQIKPQTIFDRMMVRDQTDKYWEELRCKRSIAALIDGAFRQALQSLLMSTAPIFIPTAITHQFYTGDAKAMKEIELFLQKHGLTMDQVQAKAMHIMGGTLQMLDRMSVNRETTRRILRKENERHLAAANAASEKAEE